MHRGTLPGTPSGGCAGPELAASITLHQSALSVPKLCLVTLHLLITVSSSQFGGIGQ